LKKIVTIALLALAFLPIAGAVIETEQEAGVDNSPFCLAATQEVVAEWYLDGGLFATNATYSSNHCIELQWNESQIGLHNLTVVVSNQYGSSASSSWNVTVTNTIIAVKAIRTELFPLNLTLANNFTGRFYLDDVIVQQNLTPAKNHSYNKRWDYTEIGDHYLQFVGEKAAIPEEGIPALPVRWGKKTFVGTFFLTNESVPVVNITVKSLLLAPGDVANLTTVVDIETIDIPVQLIHGMTRTSQKLINLSAYQVAENWTEINSTRQIQQSGGKNVTVFNTTLFAGNNNGTFYVDLMGPAVEYNSGSYESGNRRIPVNRIMAEMKISWQPDINGDFNTKNSVDVALMRKYASANGGIGTDVSNCPDIYCKRCDLNGDGKVNRTDYNLLLAIPAGPVIVVS